MLAIALLTGSFFYEEPPDTVEPEYGPEVRCECAMEVYWVAEQGWSY